jgi:anti-sigma B factor antagonist
MASRLLARAERATSTPSSGAAPQPTFEPVPGMAESVLCRAAGELDAAAVQPLNERILAALGETARFLFFDFTRVDDLKAGGVGLLVALQKRLRAKGGDLVLVGLRPRQRRFLDTCGFRGFFSSALDLESAVEYILGITRDIFPIAAVCPACSTPLGIDGPGRSRCRACGAVLAAMADGSVELG